MALTVKSTKRLFCIFIVVLGFFATGGIVHVWSGYSFDDYRNVTGTLKIFAVSYFVLLIPTVFTETAKWERRIYNTVLAIGAIAMVIDLYWVLYVIRWDR